MVSTLRILVIIIKINCKIWVLQYCIYHMTPSRYPNPLGVFIPTLPDLSCESKRISRCRLSRPKLNTLSFAVVSLITLFFYNNVVFPAQDEYSYFSADFRLK